MSRPQHKYTKEELDFIKSFAKGHSYKEIAEEFNKQFDYQISFSQIKGCLGRYKIHTGMKSQFQKGHIPHNKGKKMPQEVYEKCKGTMFQKGNVSPNHKLVGTETIRHNHNKDEKYIYVKVAEPNTWELKHRLVWEKHYGEVPKDKIVTFLDGNTLNCDISNLALIDRSLNAIINKNRMKTDNAECNKSVIEVARLMKRVADAQRRVKK